MFNNEWDNILSNEFNKDYYIKLKNYLETIQNSYCLSEKENIFNALNILPIVMLKL